MVMAMFGDTANCTDIASTPLDENQSTQRSENNLIVTDILSQDLPQSCLEKDEKPGPCSSKTNPSIQPPNVTGLSTFFVEEPSPLPIRGQEFRFGNLVFTSKFDSGNLNKVEKVLKENSTTSENKIGYVDVVADLEFNLWTRPDCADSPYENANRSWFYFGIRGYTPGKLIKLNIMNMNRQGKLYSQGHTPFVRILPQKPSWERLKERCSYECSATEFILTFLYRFPECRGTVYFAFSYPWSYTESQRQMEKLDQIFQDSDSNITGRKEDDIYYYRELFINSLDGLRVDLLTITSYDGITEQREPYYDSQLFPNKHMPRCRNFRGKRVFVLTSRVHPGESPASSVYNGFLEFILRKNDPRAMQLRKQYVFKFIPMLNPDGVVRGHYRTDPFGVNLNRMYLDPDIQLYPTIYAAKSLLVFHHMNNCEKRRDYIPRMSAIFTELTDCKKKTEQMGSGGQGSPRSSAGSAESENHPRSCHFELGDEELVRSESILDRCSSIDSHATLIIPPISGSGTVLIGTDHLNHPYLRLIPPHESGVAFYVDLHGHASKRGCFMYGNHFSEEESAVTNLLFPKLISLNSAHFDYGGCNFTEKNMYTKDKRDSCSKEGSGRVAIYKSIGIIHSYTLECNYNSGRLVNSIASSSNGRFTPPPLAGFPPKFTQAHYEEVGRALAISAIDYTDTNPWSRIQHSELPSIQAVKMWIRRSLVSGKGINKFNKPALSLNPKNLSKSTSLTTVRSEPLMRARLLQANQSNNEPSQQPPRAGFSFGTTPRFGESDSDGNRKANKELGPVREGRRSLSLPSPTMLVKCSNRGASRSTGDISHTRSYSLRLMHTLSRQNNTTVKVFQNQQQNDIAQVGVVVDEKQLSKENCDVTQAVNTGISRTETPPPHPLQPPVQLDALDTSNQRVTDKRILNFNRTSNIPLQGTESDESRRFGPNPAGRTLASTNAASRIIERANELGFSFQRNPTKRSGAKKTSANRKTRTRTTDINKAGVVVQRGGNSELVKGANIQLSNRQRNLERPKPTGQLQTGSEVEKFEKQLQDRVSNFDHSSSFWVEL